MQSTTENFYNFTEWKKAAKAKNMTVKNMGRMAGTLKGKNVDIWYANSDKESDSGIFNKGKGWNSGTLTYGD